MQVRISSPNCRLTKQRMYDSSSHVMPHESATNPSFNPRDLPTTMLRKIIVKALKMGANSTIYLSMGSQIVGYQHDQYVDNNDIKWFCQMEEITAATISMYIR